MFDRDKIEKVQANLLLILKDFDKICRENGIKYSLIGGSLIGAIRDKGFLAWDDDADVIMERNHYEKLLSILPEQYKLKRYLWMPRLIKNDGTSKKNLSGGNYIDILIFDKMPGTMLKHKAKLVLLRVLQGMLKENLDYANYNIKGKILSLITHIIGMPFPVNKKLVWYDQTAQLGKNGASAFICSYTDQYRYLHHIFPQEIIREYIDVAFEDTQLMAMAGYDYYLTKNFGDYMTPPPIDKQIPEHGNV
jgi:lipopolysaccharide cholinephosphotransferase